MSGHHPHNANIIATSIIILTLMTATPIILTLMTCRSRRMGDRRLNNFDVELVYCILCSLVPSPFVLLSPPGAFKSVQSTCSSEGSLFLMPL